MCYILKLDIQHLPCLAETQFIFFENNVDPDKLASDEAIMIHTVFYSDYDYMLITGVLQINRIKNREECRY